ncbi:MAG: methylmalonyl Co-A mutase-associated GTPase MeaB [Fimbriimonadaceae bacterium]|nr:methylmalonyl Co-A mutase-associated GTPase MeaB [Fimbriimonadaceae bacterium]
MDTMTDDAPLPGLAADSSLHVAGGVEAPPTMNPRFVARRPRERSPEMLGEGVFAGDPVALSMAITLIESSRTEDQEPAQRLLDLCAARAGKAVRVGITGVPGVGKSTFIETLGLRLLVAQSRKLAVLAVDPTSQVSGGSILGDKSRMAGLAAHPRSFIRPSPAGKTLGGVTRRTRETMLLCEAAGFDLVFVETVGVGQSELAVHGMVDCFLLLTLAGGGDELQGIKRGVMEMADLIAVTKADGDNVRAAELARQRYENAVHLFGATPSGWHAPTLLCSAVTGEGVDDVWSTVERFVAHERSTGFFERRRNEQRRAWFREQVETRVLDAFLARPGVADRRAYLEGLVMRGEVSPRRAAAILVGDQDG